MANQCKKNKTVLVVGAGIAGLAPTTPCPRTNEKNHTKVVNKKVNYLLLRTRVRLLAYLFENAGGRVVDGTGFEPVTPAV